MCQPIGSLAACLPGDRNGVTVAHRAEGDDAPPERMREAGKVLVVVLLHHVDDEGGEDEHDEADVHGGDQLLEQSFSYLKKITIYTSAKISPNQM